MKGILAHFIGDYILQSNWMAANKTSSSKIAAIHALCYSLPFLFYKPSRRAYAVIVITHFLIDRFRLARYVIWAKDWLAPRGERHELTLTGMQDDVPMWMSVWLMILTDNLMHVIINHAALSQDVKRQQLENIYHLLGHYMEDIRA